MFLVNLKLFLGQNKEVFCLSLENLDVLEVYFTVKMKRKLSAKTTQT